MKRGARGRPGARAGAAKAIVATAAGFAQVRTGDAFERRVRILVADGKLPSTLGKELLEIHRTAMQRRNGQ
jgi:hypothetical protein